MNKPKRELKFSSRFRIRIRVIWSDPVRVLEYGRIRCENRGLKFIKNLIFLAIFVEQSDNKVLNMNYIDFYVERKRKRSIFFCRIRIRVFFYGRARISDPVISRRLDTDQEKKTHPDPKLFLSAENPSENQ